MGRYQLSGWIARLAVMAGMGAAGGGGVWAQAIPASQKYTWKNVQIVGGGFVDGIIFHPTVAGLSYARTDIGGAYRRDGQRSPWTPITDWVSYRDVNLMGPESIAVDPHEPDRLYIATGMYPNNNAAMLRSSDRGKTFQRTDVPFGMGGNADGRGNGERLMVDPNDGRVLYFGSRAAGLWQSRDGAVSWSHVEGFPNLAENSGRGARGGMGGGDGIVCVIVDPRTGGRGKASGTIYAGVSVVNQASVYRSTDGGKTWAAVPGQPTNLRPTHGLLAPGGVIYFSYGSAPGPSEMHDGAVWKLNTATGKWTDITPEKTDPANPDKAFGYAAVAVDAHQAGVVLASSYHRRAGEELWRSADGGKTWKGIFHNGMAEGVFDDALQPYAAHTPIHWLFDVEIDPFDANRAMFTTGYGGWETFDLGAVDAGKPTHWQPFATGIEETVSLALASPPDGAHLISAIGDYGGFVHWDLDKPPPEGNFTNPFFANATDVTVAAKNPGVIVRVGTQAGGINAGATGAIGYSLDGGRSWQVPENPPMGSNGSAAVSADGERWIWSTAVTMRGRGLFPTTAPATGQASGTGSASRGGRGMGGGVYVTADRGKTWQASMGVPAGTRVIADPVNPRQFYGMNLFAGRFFESSDGGLNFSEMPLNLPGRASSNGGRGGRGDSRGGQDRLYATPGIEGDLWVAAYDGLYHSNDHGRTWADTKSGVNQLHAFGFGKAAPGANVPAIYAVATVNGLRGVFRSDDDARTWVRINDDAHQWGLILQITGDPRIYGRVYVGTHGRGILYGDPS